MWSAELAHIIIRLFNFQENVQNTYSQKKINKKLHSILYLLHKNFKYTLRVYGNRGQGTERNQEDVSQTQTIREMF